MSGVIRQISFSPLQQLNPSWLIKCHVLEVGMCEQECRRRQCREVGTSARLWEGCGEKLGGFYNQRAHREQDLKVTVGVVNPGFKRTARRERDKGNWPTASPYICLPGLPTLAYITLPINLQDRLLLLPTETPWKTPKLVFERGQSKDKAFVPFTLPTCLPGQTGWGYHGDEISHWKWEDLGSTPE